MERERRVRERRVRERERRVRERDRGKWERERNIRIVLFMCYLPIPIIYSTVPALILVCVSRETTTTILITYILFQY